MSAVAFPARYSGRCAECQYFFVPGELIVKNKEYGYKHAVCPDDPTDGEAVPGMYHDDDDGPPRDYGDL